MLESIVIYVPFFYFQVSVFDGTYDIRTPHTDFTVITVQGDEDRPMRS